MSMMDITTLLEKAVASTIVWSGETFIGLLHSLAAGVDGASIDWDEGAGENWGRLLVGDEVIAMVFRPRPLMVVRSPLSEHDASAGVPVLAVEDMSAEVFSAERAVVERLVDRAISSDWDDAKFSVDELWWATVT